MKDAIENLLPLERNVFFLLNGSDSLFLDNLFWTITGKLIWVPVLLFLAVMLFYKTSLKTAVLTLLSIVLLFALCDQISSSLFKTYFERLRPTHHPDFMNLVDTVRNYRSGGFSFISGHATNSFGIAVLLSRVFMSRWVTIPIITWAVLNSYSRLYLGVHFISDIVAGMIVGTVIALGVYIVYRLIERRALKVNYVNSERPTLYTIESARTIGITVSIYILFVVIFSPILSTLPH